MKRIFLLLLVSLVLSFNAYAKDYTFPELTGRVVDSAEVLSPKQEKELEKLLSSDKINQVVIATVEDLQGDADGRDFALNLARKWKLGDKDKNNGVLILLAVKDRYVGIEVGYGLEGTLTDSISGHIARNLMYPDFRSKNWYEGLHKGADAVIKILAGEEPEKIAGTDNDVLIILGILLFLLLLAILSAIFELPLFDIFLACFPGGGSGFSGRGGGFGGGGFGGRF